MKTCDCRTSGMVWRRWLPCSKWTSRPGLVSPSDSELPFAAPNEKGGIMRPLRSILCFLAFGLSALAPQISAQAAPSTHRIVIAAGTVLDGKRKSLKNVRIAIEVSKIVAVNPDVEGGGMSLSQEQLSAACDEARKQGLRTLVHAYKEAVRAATLAGCTEVEHGTLAPDDDLKLMAEKGTYFDPQCGLVIENYLQNRERYLGTQGYTAEGFAAMEKILPMDHEIVE